MKDKLLFENEKMITQSDNDLVTLTTHRIEYHSTSLGKEIITSIMLDKISSIEVNFSQAFWALIVGALSVLIGLYYGTINQGNIMISGLVIGIVFLLIFLFTRQHVIIISSDGGAKIKFEIKEMNDSTVLEFVNKIEKAKSDYYLSNK